MSQNDPSGIPAGSTPPLDNRAGCSAKDGGDLVEDVLPIHAGPSFNGDETSPGRDEQLPMDLIDEESMESFPCSDPPSYSTCHA